MSDLRDLPAHWRGRAEMLKPYAPAGAQAFEDAAAELDSALFSHDMEAMNLKQAAEESGYSAEHLGRLLKAGKLPNAGKKGAPKLLRKDLPRKALKATGTEGRFQRILRQADTARIR